MVFAYCVKSPEELSALRERISKFEQFITLQRNGDLVASAEDSPYLSLTPLERTLNLTTTYIEPEKSSGEIRGIHVNDKCERERIRFRGADQEEVSIIIDDKDVFNIRYSKQTQINLSP